MNAVHVLYNLAAHPEYFEEIRVEVQEVTCKDSGWQETPYAKLRKLDRLHEGESEVQAS